MTVMRLCTNQPCKLARRLCDVHPLFFYSCVVVCAEFIVIAVLLLLPSKGSRGKVDSEGPHGIMDERDHMRQTRLHALQTRGLDSALQTLGRSCAWIIKLSGSLFNMSAKRSSANFIVS